MFIHQQTGGGTGWSKSIRRHTFFFIFCFVLLQGCSWIESSPPENKEPPETGGLLDMPDGQDRGADPETYPLTEEETKDRIWPGGEDQGDLNERSNVPFQPDPPMTPKDGKREHSASAGPSEPSPSHLPPLDGNIDFLEKQLEARPGSTRSRLLLATLRILKHRDQEVLPLLRDTTGSHGDLKNLLEARTFYGIGANVKAIRKLESILGRWEKAAPLNIVKAHFVENVDGYEQYRRVPGRVFSPGDFLKLYVLVGRFGAEKKKNQYRVSFQVNYDIIRKEWMPEKSREKEVRIDLPASARQGQLTLERSYDFRIRHKHLAIGIPLPEDISQGKNYYLNLKIDDQVSQKSGNYEIKFEIR